MRISQYEYMQAVTPAEDYNSEPDESRAEESPEAIAATMTREALRLVSEVFDWNSESGGVLLARFAGLSLAEIGARRGISKQAIHKRIRCIVEQWPQLGPVLLPNNSYDEQMAEPKIINSKISDVNEKWKEATRWMKKVN